MAKSKELGSDVKQLIVKLLQDEVKKAELARKFGIPRTTITSFNQRFTLSGHVENKLRSGRQKTFAGRSDIALSRLVKSDRKGTLADITNKVNETYTSTFCTRTVRRKLFTLGYKRRAVSKRMVVKSDNRKMRVLWCKETRYWTVHEHWGKWVIYDERQVVISTNNRAYIWRKYHEVNNPYLMCTPSKKKLSIMIWGCMCYRGMETLAAVNDSINSQKDIDILEENVLPVIPRHFPDDNYVYMDDNAPRT